MSNTSISTNSWPYACASVPCTDHLNSNRKIRSPINPNRKFTVVLLRPYYSRKVNYYLYNWGCRWLWPIHVTKSLFKIAYRVTRSQILRSQMSLNRSHSTFVRRQFLEKNLTSRNGVKFTNHLGKEVIHFFPSQILRSQITLNRSPFVRRQWPVSRKILSLDMDLSCLRPSVDLRFDQKLVPVTFYVSWVTGHQCQSQVP